MRSKPREIRCKSAGYTLLELMVALPLTIGLLLAVAGLINAMSQNQNFAESALANRVQSLEKSQIVLSNLHFAQSLADYSDHSVEFSTQDRDSDEHEDSLRYWWSGVIGHPLMYSLNGSAGVSLVDNVHQFKLVYVPAYEDSETLLKYHDDSMGGQFSGWQINDSQIASQLITPDLPPAATKWSLNRIRLRLRSVGVADGEIMIGIYKALADLPSDSLYQATPVHESELDSQYTWFDVYFSNVRDVEVDLPVCVVIRSANAGTDSACEVCYETGGLNMTADTHWMTSSDGGNTWVEGDANTDMRFFAIGIHDSVRKSRRVVQKVQLDFQVGGDDAAKVISTARIINEPEIHPALRVSEVDDPVEAEPVGSMGEPGTDSGDDDSMGDDTGEPDSFEEVGTVDSHRGASSGANDVGGALEPSGL